MSLIRTAPQSCTIQWRPRAWSISIMNPLSGRRVVSFNVHRILIIDGVETDIKVPDTCIEVILPDDALKQVSFTSPITGQPMTFLFGDMGEAFEECFCEMWKQLNPGVALEG